MKSITFFVVFLLLCSCGNKQNTNNDESKETPKLSVVETHTPLIAVNEGFTKEIEDWKEFNALISFIKKFEKVSPREALSNALELNDLVKNLKDSVVPAIFNIPSFHARVNVLENETLRLADLTLISAITADDVNSQVEKTIAAASSVNSKINTILSKKRFEDEINFDLDNIGIDSTKIDSLSRKTIDMNKQKKQVKKKYTPEK
ncbi:hypothetical protein [Polaribacter septentrionalilitoris]|uniref:hypothetical protein n=1 Tax=Polaribacter septentrionalilitoris TaxID=2494657 RepID=UPI00135B1544|nr:hypothetical protein [Polaribacter septentrionalilitoris]